ncbi:aromatic-ring-hydroxylating dioxygenase subunit beta [Streptomyces puniciscabiei]
MTDTANTVDLETRIAVNDLLVTEAALLDAGRFEDWLGLLSDDITYTAPLRVTRKSGAPDVVEEMNWYDDNLHSLGLRVKRLATDVAWAEDPPSMTRRFVTNLRVTAVGEEFEAVCNVLMFRSRGDQGNCDLIGYERTDRLRRVEGRLKLCARRVVLDQASLGTKNLAVFL